MTRVREQILFAAGAVVLAGQVCAQESRVLDAAREWQDDVGVMLALPPPQPDLQAESSAAASPDGPGEDGSGAEQPAPDPLQSRASEPATAAAPPADGAASRTPGAGSGPADDQADMDGDAGARAPEPRPAALGAGAAEDSQAGPPDEAATNGEALATAAAQPPDATGLAPELPAAVPGYFDQLTASQEQDIVDKAFPLLAAKWPFNKVFVCWEDAAPQTLADRLAVQDAIRSTWEDVSGLQFLGWGQCQPGMRGIRIAVRDEGPHVKYLGKYLDGVPDGMVLNFTYEAWGSGCADMRDYCNRSIAVHEFGHAIGFAHEQNRPDTPGECDAAQQGTMGDSIGLTPWDPHSVMNYCNPAYNNDGQLSPFDIVAVRYIYGEGG